MQNRKLYLGAAAASVAVLGSVALTAPSNATTPAHGRHHDQTVQGRLNPLNNSGASGYASVSVDGRTLHVRYDASRLAPGLPHAAHFHFDADARHQCPSVRDDVNHDFRLNVAEGHPAYGMIVTSLTTKGDTSPASALAVTRFPTAPHGMVEYRRTIRVSKAVAHAVRSGEATLVVHGVDYNNNGAYDFDRAGPSELDASLPAEATDPALCGVLR
jgi:hypothetical protein